MKETHRDADTNPMLPRASRLAFAAAVVAGVCAVAMPTGALAYWKVVHLGPHVSRAHVSRSRAAALVAVSERLATNAALQAGVLSGVNSVRRAHGLAPLQLSAGLAGAAHQHSVEMATRGYFGHSSANGSSFDRRIGRYYPIGGHRYWSVGENLLWSSPDVDAAGALDMWMKSPEHRANLLTGRWREIGLSAVHADSAPGAYGGSPVTIVTADFGVRR